jgi:hypothetical protein
MDPGITVIVDEPFMFDDVQRCIKSFHGVNFDTSESGGVQQTCHG